MKIEKLTFTTSSSKTVPIYRVEGVYYLSLAGVSSLLNQNLSSVTRRMKKSAKKYPSILQKMQINRRGRPIYLCAVDAFLLTFQHHDVLETERLRSFLDSQVPAEVVPAEENYKNISFHRDNISVKVHVFEDAPDDVWLSQKQIAKLYDVSVSTISEHIKTILESGEIDSGSIFRNFRNVGRAGRVYATLLYGLDMILSIGYRVNSRIGSEFRKWATKTIREKMGIPRLADKASDSLRDNPDFIRLERKVDTIEIRLQQISPVKERLFCPGELFDARMEIERIVFSAKKSLIIVDPYFDANALSIFTNKRKDVPLQAYGSRNAKLDAKDIESFNAQYGGLSYATREDFHDRFLLIDETEAYLIGASLNALGNKTFALIHLEDKAFTADLLGRIKKRP